MHGIIDTMVKIKMTRNATIPGFGLALKGASYHLTLTEATYVVNRSCGYVADGSCLIDLLLDRAPLPTIADHYHHLGVVQSKLEGMAKSGVVHIVGCGPSASQFSRDDIGEDDIVISCNASVSICTPDVALMVEGVCVNQPWFEDVLNFPGIKVLDCAIASQLASREARKRSANYWREILWVRRRAYNEGEDLSQIGLGLVYVEKHGVIRGTVTAQAVHLAKVMGAHTVHLYGVELYFPDGQQHFYDGQVYTEGNTPESLTLYGDKWSTPYFMESAGAIRKVAEAAGVQMVDHSGGLLS